MLVWKVRGVSETFETQNTSQTCQPVQNMRDAAIYFVTKDLVSACDNAQLRKPYFYFNTLNTNSPLKNVYNSSVLGNCKLKINNWKEAWSGASNIVLAAGVQDIRGNATDWYGLLQEKNGSEYIMPYQTSIINSSGPPKETCLTFNGQSNIYYARPISFNTVNKTTVVTNVCSGQLVTNEKGHSVRIPSIYLRIAPQANTMDAYKNNKFKNIEIVHDRNPIALPSLSNITFTDKYLPLLRTFFTEKVDKSVRNGKVTETVQIIPRTDQIVQVEVWMRNICGASVKMAEHRASMKFTTTGTLKTMTMSVFSIPAASHKFGSYEELLQRKNALMEELRTYYNSLQVCVDQTQSLAQPSGWTRAQLISEIGSKCRVDAATEQNVQKYAEMRGMMNDMEKKWQDYFKIALLQGQIVLTPVDTTIQVSDLYSFEDMKNGNVDVGTARIYVKLA